VLRNLGMVARSRGDYVRATAYFRESVAQAGLGSSTGGYNEGRGLSHLGRTLFLQGEAADAKQVFGEALDIMQQERLAGHTLADCLDWLAALVDTEGRPWQAAVLFGAAAAQWQASGAVRYPPEQAAYAAELAHARAQLRPEEFAAAWAEGHAMSRQQAVAFALEQVRAGDVPLA
jgi:tetratricopeptide (TPR) repeat protein